LPAIGKAIKPRPRIANGGTAAPRGVAVGPARSFGGGPQRFKPKGQSPNTEYLKSQRQGGGAPTPGSTPASTPLPWDGAYEGAAGNANLRYQNSLTALGAQRSALQQDYGLDPGFNDLKANPYSRAAALEQAYRRNQRGSGTSLAAAGQLYSGASQNAETYNREHNAQDRDALEKVYRAALQDLTNQEVEAGDRRNAELSEAGWRRVEGASSAPLEPAPVPGGKTKPKKAKAGISNNKSLGKKKRKR